MQFLLGLNLPYVTGNVLRQLEGSFVHLSIQKFSSNVVERCLKDSNQEELTWIIGELLGSPNPLMLLQDAYGNYVIQTALAVAKVWLSDQSHCFRALPIVFICFFFACGTPTQGWCGFFNPLQPQSRTPLN